jgi:UDP-glucose 4-epimerase
MLVSEKMEELNKKRANSPDDLAYNIGTGRGSSVNLLYKLLSDAIGFKEDPIYAPPRKGEVRRIYLDTTKAKKEINWKSEINLQQGLTKTVKWFRKSL